MRDIRLEEMPFDFGGKTYILRCNMNVLADVQDEFDGDLVAALDGKNPVGTSLRFLAAMMNDYADEMGWPERFTHKTLGRQLGFGDMRYTEIMGMVFRSLTPPTDDGEMKTEEGDAAPAEGNAGN